MKLSDFGKKKAKKPEEKKPTGSWTKSRERFVKLKPLDFNAMTDSVMVCDVSHRPYISKIASNEGFTYASFGVGNGKMVVMRYKLKKD
jgi:hypothetical protein